MNYRILVAIVIAIVGSVIVATIVKKSRQAFLVPEGYARLLYHSPNIEESGAS